MPPTQTLMALDATVERWTVARLRALIPRVAAAGEAVTAERMRAAIAQRRDAEVLPVGDQIAKVLKEIEGR